MKTLLYTLLLLMISAGAFSQQATTEQSVRQQDYLKKSKNQKRTGTVLLLGGAGLIATAIIIPKGELLRDGFCVGVWCDTTYENTELKSYFGAAGGIMALSSIPFFISSGKNRKRAASLGLNFEQAGPLYAGDRMYTPYPALSINTTF